VAMALGLLLTSSLLTFYSSQKNTYQYIQAMVRIRENAEIAIQQFSHDIRMAGLSGCLPLNEYQFYNPISTVNYSTATSLFGFHNGHSSNPYFPAPLSSILSSAKPNTDILVIQEPQLQLFAPIAKGRKIPVDEVTEFKAGDLYLIADCNHAELFHTQSGKRKTIITQLALHHEYKNAELGRFAIIVYYIADTKRKNAAGNTIFALYRRDLTASAKIQTELVEGVDDLQIGYSTANQAQLFMTADHVSDWKNISWVRIKLLFDSIEPIRDSAQSYIFNDKKYLAPDRRLYREWATSVALREKIP
jgi:type IV pilus assembly protein PilW